MLEHFDKKADNYLTDFSSKVLPIAAFQTIEVITFSFVTYVQNLHARNVLIPV